MKPGRYDLPDIWRGSDCIPVTFTWLDANGNPIDLTNWTPFALSDEFNLFPVKTDPVNGVTTLLSGITNTITPTLNLGVHQWNWFFEHVSGFITTPLISGTVEVKNLIVDV